MNRFFVVAVQAEWVYSGEVAVGRRPVSLAHAKEMGTGQTACGSRCTTWEKLWDLEFPIADRQNCAACLEAVGDVVRQMNGVAGRSLH